MPSLRSNSSTRWDRHAGHTLAVSWADPNNSGSGRVSVKIGDDPAMSFSVPQASIEINNKAGKLTNNTDKTINYTLS